MPRSKKTRASRSSNTKRSFDARPDTLDFRDQMFTPTLIDVPQERPLPTYLKELKHRPKILDQGQEGACTGFGLAAVCHYLLSTRKVRPSTARISPRMLYENAKRYDEWPGRNYEGSSCRGAVKGWYKHGVCLEKLWPHVPGKRDSRLTRVRSEDAAERPLGAYQRVNHQSLVAMHAALAEVGILFASASVHAGWDEVTASGIILHRKRILGGHAFAIIGYDEDGFWIQNSWGAGWGKRGFGHVSYSDWLENGSDVWVARLGVPVRVGADATVGRNMDLTATAGKSVADLRNHIVSIGNDGKLRDSGEYGSEPEDIEELFDKTIPDAISGWKKRRILIYAHGGLVSEDAAITRIAEYVKALEGTEIYPLAFIWKTDYWTTVTNMLRDALKKRRSEGFLDDAKDFMLDRLDDALEPIARSLTGKLVWDEMKENAVRATGRMSGGARLVADKLAALAAADPKVEIHFVGHSAGSIFHGPLVQYLATDGEIDRGPLAGQAGLGQKIETCTLWAPACTTQFFKETYLQVIESRTLKNIALFNLTDEFEQDDHCAHIYNKSLLYLVSHAFEERARIPLFRDGEPLLGMAKYLQKDAGLRKLLKRRYASLVLAPNNKPVGDINASGSRSHGGFDDDDATVKATFARILGTSSRNISVSFVRSSSSLADQRSTL